MLRADLGSHPHRCPILAAARRYSPKSGLVCRKGVVLELKSWTKTYCGWPMSSWTDGTFGWSSTWTSFAMQERR